MPLIVFSDLDGTLLDHHDYSFDPARPALAALRQLGCGVILASSKTAEEIISLRAEMGLSDWPAIVENGGGLLAPGNGFPASNDYHRLREFLKNLPQNLRQSFEGFGDMSVDRVISITGLSEAATAKAKARQFSEPGLWTGSEGDASAFLKLAQKAGISARRGGRFLTLSFGATKADHMAVLKDQFQAAKTLALGDAPNDIEMIETADIGVIIHNPSSQPLPKLPKEEAGAILRTTEAGPEGWNRAVLSILSSEGLID